MIFFTFYQVSNLFPASVLFKKTTPSQINLIKKCKKSFFISDQIQKCRKCPALLLYDYILITYQYILYIDYLSIYMIIIYYMLIIYYYLYILRILIFSIIFKIIIFVLLVLSGHY